MKSIAVFCGSSEGASGVYKESAKTLGRELASRGIALVYGGACVGIMGAVADAVLEAGGQAIGVLPGFLQGREISHKGLTELIIVETMHERKAKMAELADGYVALPGGPGTLEEFFEIFTWSQLGLHRKPCGLLNANRYYDSLVEMFRHMAKERFMSEAYLESLLVRDEPAALLDRFATYEAPGIKTY